jgi:hypothetical protein
MLASASTTGSALRLTRDNTSARRAEERLARRLGSLAGAPDAPQPETAGLTLMSARSTYIETTSRASLPYWDLWSGWALRGAGRWFDPAVYYGDREADLAMTELFGGFPREFYQAYEETFPLAEGYDKLKHLYNLYHLLNHLNLFGRGYLGQVRSCLRLLGL